MKIYKGVRLQEGVLVTVNDAPLDPQIELRDFHSAGFEWGYDGSGPSQLAFAILADHLGPKGAFDNYRSFMAMGIAEIEADEWTMTSEDIDNRLGQIVEVPMDLKTLLKKVRGEI